MRSEITRRQFLLQAAMSMLTVSATARDLHVKSFPDEVSLAVQEQLLNLVNEERAAASVSALKLDDLASRVAKAHAVEMAQNAFLSHWGLNGFKPYHRYSFAGGTEATEENDSQAEHDGPVNAEDIASDLILMHRSMYEEKPPHDGHRQTMLAPQHTHVGFGIGVEGSHVRLCELYVARYVAIDRYPTTQKPGSSFLLSGQVLDPRYTVQGIDVCYEPLPSPPDLAWLRVLRPYGLPKDRETLYPKLADGFHYDDGSKGSIELQTGGTFRVPVLLNRKRSGIYTIVIWIQRGDANPFEAAEICIRAE
jgi:uncharacterized protein YkwD